MKRLIANFPAIIGIMVLFASCDPKSIDTTVSVSTLDATGVTYSSAHLTGNANLSTTVSPDLIMGFQYSKDSDILPSKASSVDAFYANDQHNFAAQINCLEPETTYYFRAFIRQNGQDIYGETKSFTTAHLPEGAVDLGLVMTRLSDGSAYTLYWSECNLGATKPEEYGDYYAWGEMEPYYSSQAPLIWKDGKERGYNWASYRWCDGSYDTQTKYCTRSSYGIVDNNTVLEFEDDVAHAKLGGNWRMPTFVEWWTLYTECTWTWTTDNGIKGRKVTGPNGNSIFLPASGERQETLLDHVGSIGLYWSSSLFEGNPSRATNIDFDSDLVYCGENTPRYVGFSIRPVTE